MELKRNEVKTYSGTSSLLNNNTRLSLASVFKVVLRAAEPSLYDEDCLPPSHNWDENLEPYNDVDHCLVHLKGWAITQNRVRQVRSLLQGYPATDA
jgi:hypothetical protein